MRNFLALGDSYTIGANVSEKERWPVQLAAELRARGYSLDDPDIVAQTGWTTDELIMGIALTNLQGSYSLVSLQIGVNNQFRGRELSNYRVEFNKLMRIAIEFASGQQNNVFAISIPDWGVTPFAGGKNSLKISEEIDRFNQVMKAVTMAAGGRFVDITPLSREVVGDPAMLAEDGLHPSGAMYAAWVERILPVAEEILKRKT